MDTFKEIKILIKKSMILIFYMFKKILENNYNSYKKIREK